MLQFLEKSHVVHACPAAIIAANEDVFNGDPASDVISMANAESAVFMVILGSGVTGTATLEVFACDDVTPTTTAAISFSVKRVAAPDTQGAMSESQAYATTAGGDDIYIVEVEAAKVAEKGYKYVQFRATEKVNNPVDGAIFGFLMGLRHKVDQLDTQVT